MTEQKRTVLFVDDEENILHALKRSLRNSEFSCMFSSNGREALELIAKNDIQVIVTDEQMPEMGGIELLQQVKELHPDIIRIILSGYTDSDRLIRSINEGEIYRFISKPWEENELVDVIKDGFTRYNTLQGFKIYMKRIIDDNIELMEKMKSYESSIELNSDLLNMIPQPLIAVSIDGLTELVNKEAIKLFGDEISKGVHINKIFDDVTTSRIMGSLELPNGQTSFTAKYNNHCIRIYTKLLKRNTANGLLFFEKVCKEYD